MSNSGAFIPSIYRYTQTEASTDWVIVHNLGSNGSAGVPIVDVYMDVNGQKAKVIPKIVTINSKNSVTVTFGEPQTGEAIIVV